MRSPPRIALEQALIVCRYYADLANFLILGAEHRATIALCRRPIIAAGRAGSVTRAPSRKRSVPSTTTRSPAESPEVTAAVGAIGRTDFDRADGNSVVGVDHVNIGTGCAALDRRSWHDDDVM